MSLYDWLLFVHMLAAFAIVAAVALFTVLVAAPEPPVLRLTPLARRLWDIGGGGTLLFGVWLALNRPEYEIWDGWVIAALVLWLIAAAAGANLGRALEGRTSGPPPRVLYAVATVAVAALLVDMIFKPGA